MYGYLKTDHQGTPKWSYQKKLLSQLAPLFSQLSEVILDIVIDIVTVEPVRLFKVKGHIAKCKLDLCACSSFYL